ncbi:MAG: 50S ribosomal protein L30 [Ardenticatenales bacterium]|jgi:large subunit ribosomal protein L30|nr:50S ribosomal protein L30 [Ardenticatenales bacterium]
MSSEMVRVTYVKSAIGYSQRQKDTVRSLGLRRLGESVLVPDNPAIRGMVAAVDHLVRIDPVADADVTFVDA